VADDGTFGEFRRDYQEWWQQTLALPVRRRGHAAASAFELDLDHVIDHVRSVGSLAADGSTALEYPKIATKCREDVARLQARLEQDPLSDVECALYGAYLRRLDALLARLAALPVPEDGHLGFKRSARTAFGFLVREYHFTEVEDSPISVTFARDALRVELNYSPEYPANGVVVISSPPSQDPDSLLMLDDFVFAETEQLTFDYSPYDLTRSSGVEAFFHAAASVVRRQGDRLLRGDPDGVRQLLVAAAARERAYIELMERTGSR